MFVLCTRRKISRAVLVCSACISLFAGCIIARWYLFDTVWLALILLGMFLVTSKRQTILVLLLLCACCFCVGWWRGGVYMERLAVNEQLYGRKVTLIGRAADDAVYSKRYQLEFTVAHVRVIAPERATLTGAVTVRGFGEAVVYRGDTVRATGTLFPVRGNSVASVSYAQLYVVRRGSSGLDGFRRTFAAGIQSALPEPAASFAMGLLIGQRSTLPDDIGKQLRYAGLTHIVAVSGYNLTIIVLACRRLLASRSKYQTTLACVLLIVLFLAITGLSPPIVRASVISLIGLAVWYYGRTIAPLVLLLFSAAITILVNPTYLWGNVSWYLSFLSFFGVLVVAPLLTKRLFQKTQPPALVSIVIETTCANTMVLPYSLFIFGQAPLYSLVANVLVVPCIPFAMLLSAFAGIGGMLLPVLAGWIALPATILLTYMIDVARLVAAIPHSYVENAYLSGWSMGIVYCVMGAMLCTLMVKVRALIPRKPQCTAKM